jgi:hypothetical protein
MLWKRHGLSITLFGLFVLFVVAQAWFGMDAYNEERSDMGQAPLSMAHYLVSGHFVSAIFENWESEFLQMGMYVVLTVKLRQVGSAESRPLEESEESQRVDEGLTPWPVRRGGVWLKLYENSLALAFFALFALSFSLHLFGSWQNELAERAAQGKGAVTVWHHLASARFWFESFQNWQSEFLAVLSIVVLSIFLRQKDSPQSKATEAPNGQTGD